MEIVKKEGDKEVLMVRFNAKFSLPDSKLNLADLYPKSYPKNIGGSYRVSMYNTTTQKTIDDLVLKVNITKEVADGCYADFYLENQGSVYLNGNYFTAIQQVRLTMLWEKCPLPMVVTIA